MSRTKHHRGQKSRHCGRDLWSRRAGMAGATFTTYNKKLTRQRERCEGKIVVHKLD